MAIVVPTEDTLADFDLAVPLARFAQLAQIPECSFWGVTNTSDPNYPGLDMWTKSDRDTLARALRDSQVELEDLTRYYWKPTWAIESTFFRQPVWSKRGRLIAAGVRAVDDVSLAHAPVDKSVDPMVFTVPGVTFTDEDEVMVYYPSGDARISPSYVSISAGTLTIHIPRCRLVTEAAQETVKEPERSGVDYATLANFVDNVDIKREYNDPSTNGVYVYGSGSTCSCASCSSTERDACMRIRSARLGSWETHLATYSVGAWTRSSSLCRCCPESIRLSYLSGLETLTNEQEHMIVKLALVKIPQPPCASDEWLQNMWTGARNVPDNVSNERERCPFGVSDGAWDVYVKAQNMRLRRISEL